MFVFLVPGFTKRDVWRPTLYVQKKNIYIDEKMKISLMYTDAGRTISSMLGGGGGGGGGYVSNSTGRHITGV